MNETKSATLEKPISELAAALRIFEQDPNQRSAEDACSGSKNLWATYYCVYIAKSARYVAPQREVVEGLLKRTARAFDTTRSDLLETNQLYETYREHTHFRAKMFDTLYSEGVSSVRALLDEHRVAQTASS